MIHRHQLPFIYEGFVMRTDDPMQNGRLKVWVPAIDGEYYDIDMLPWAEYASPFGGVTNDFPAGRNSSTNSGPVAYGFFAIPKMNAQVFVFFLNGEPSRRVWFASMVGYQRNRSLPAGRNISADGKTIGPLTDSEQPLQPAHDNLNAQFGGKLSDPLAQQLGAYERQVAQAKTDKNGKEGYAPGMADNSYLDPQTYSLTTPGHHAIIMTDNYDTCRVRIKSCGGNQVILDDSNGRVYISSALGNSWIELSESGEIMIYGGKNISMRAQGDMNFSADGNINMQAGKSVNIISGSDTNISSGANVNIGANGGSTILQACANIDLTGNQNIRILANNEVGITGSSGVLMSGAEVHLNGPEPEQPSCAGQATSPTLIPTHEPFTRPT
jgi:phage gp45-like